MARQDVNFNFQGTSTKEIVQDITRVERAIKSYGLASRNAAAQAGAASRQFQQQQQRFRAGSNQFSQATRRSSSNLGRNINEISELALGLGALDPRLRQVSVAFAQFGNTAFTLAKSLGPVGLAITGVITVAPSIIALFRDMGEEADNNDRENRELNKTLEEQIEIIEKLEQVRARSRREATETLGLDEIRGLIRQQEESLEAVRRGTRDFISNLEEQAGRQLPPGITDDILAGSERARQALDRLLLATEENIQQAEGLSNAYGVNSNVLRDLQRQLGEAQAAQADYNRSQAETARLEALLEDPTASFRERAEAARLLNEESELNNELLRLSEEQQRDLEKAVESTNRELDKFIQNLDKVRTTSADEIGEIAQNFSDIQQELSLLTQQGEIDIVQDLEFERIDRLVQKLNELDDIERRAFRLTEQLGEAASEARAEQIRQEINALNDRREAIESSFERESEIIKRQIQQARTRAEVISNSLQKENQAWISNVENQRRLSRMAADEFEESVERQRQAIQRRLQAQEQFGATLGSGIQASIDSLRRFRAETGQTLDALDSLRVGFEETFLGAINVGMDAFAESSIEAFEAVQEGTKSASQAWEDLGKAVIRSIVQQALVQAIQNTALGFGAIARYDFAAAGAYFTSAALWGGLAAGAFGIASATGAYEGADETASGEGGGSRTNPTLRPGQGGTSNPNIDGTAGTTAGGLGGFESAGSRERDSEGNVIIVLPSRPFTTRGEISQDLRRINRQSARQRGETISR